MPLINFRVSDEEKEAIEWNASHYGFASVSEYIRIVAVNAEITVEVPKE